MIIVKKKVSFLMAPNRGWIADICEPETLEDALSIVFDETLLGNRLYMGNYYIETGHWKDRSKQYGPRAAAVIKWGAARFHPLDWKKDWPPPASGWIGGPTAVEIITGLWTRRWEFD